MDTARKWLGRSSTASGLAAWVVWLAWRVSRPPSGVLAVVELGLELVAFVAAAIVSGGLWSWERGTASPFDPQRGRLTADRLAPLLGLHGDARALGPDDSGEAACARRALTVVDPRARRSIARTDRVPLAWAVLALEGCRRMCFVVVVVAVLLSGQFPFPVPPGWLLGVIVGAQCALAIGHTLLTAGGLRLGERTCWSMRTVGAGIGDGRSRTGLPIRWATTMGTIVVVNLAVALRGFSDRWTHGLDSLTRDERLVAMGAAWWIVGAGFLALRLLPQPSFGAEPVGRLEEPATRRLALGGTLTVAVLGCAAGMLPGAIPA